MVSIKNFTNYLENCPLDQETEIAFLNYLKGYYPPTESFTLSLIHSFFYYSLRFKYWQEHRSLLAKKIISLLHQFPELKDKPLNTDSIIELSQSQIIHIENLKELSNIILRYIKIQIKEEEQLKIITDNKSKVFCIILSKNQGLKVLSFGPTIIIRKGLLVPLAPIDHFSYNQQLEFTPDFIQTVEISPFITARFIFKQNSNNSLTGSLIRGYTFQKFEEFKKDKLSQHKNLFYAVKRVEQFYIRKDNDPLYLNLIRYLEENIEHIRSGGPLNLGFQALERGRMGHEHIFSGDKTLSLLLRTLEDSLSLRSRELEA